MALTTIKTGALADDAVTEDKIANAINTARAANTAKDLTALSASNLTSGTVPDARFPATLPAASAANLTSVPAANITGTLPAISGANLTSLPASGKATNLIINGAMLVAQRGTSSTSAGYQTVDRFGITASGTDEAPTQAQVDVASGTTPYTLGFRKALKITNGNQTSGAGATDRINIYYNVEAQDIANSGWNYTSSSSFITLSFWVKSSVAQNFYGRIYTADGTSQGYSFETGSLSADTWTKVTKTIAGNSNLTFNNDNGAGLYVVIAPFIGTDYTDSGVSLNTWAAWNGAQRTPDFTSTWYTTNNATFEITGVLLEVADSASDYPHLSYADELLKCQRYYHVVVDGQYRSGEVPIISGAMYGTLFYGVYHFKTEMRAEPSMDSVNGTDYYFVYRGGSGDSCDEISFNNVSQLQASVRVHNNLSGTSGDSGWARCNNASAFAAFSAEL